MTLNIIRQSASANNLIGALNEVAATDHTSSAGLNGLIKALLRDFRARIPTLVANRIPVTMSPSAAATVTISPVTVAATSTVIFAADSNRIGWAIQHQATSGEVYIAEGVAATLTNGRILAPDFERIQDFLYTGAINGIASSGTISVLAISYSL